MAEETTAGYLDARIDALREHFASLAAAVPQLPAAFGGVYDQILLEWQARGRGYVLGLVAAFLLLGFALEAVYRYSFPRAEAERLRAMALRFARDVGGVAVFALGSIAAFLVFDWPPRTRQAVVAFIAAFIVVRLVMVVSHALLSPWDARLRILPTGDAEAVSWYRRVALFAGWLAFGWVLAGWLAILGMDLASRQIIVYLLGLGRSPSRWDRYGAARGWWRSVSSWHGCSGCSGRTACSGWRCSPRRCRPCCGSRRPGWIMRCARRAPLPPGRAG